MRPDHWLWSTINFKQLISIYAYPIDMATVLAFAIVSSICSFHIIGFSLSWHVGSFLSRFSSVLLQNITVLKTHSTITIQSTWRHLASFGLLIIEMILVSLLTCPRQSLTWTGWIILRTFSNLANQISLIGSTTQLIVLFVWKNWCFAACCKSERSR